MDPLVDIVVPLLRRPHRISPLLQSIGAATPEPHRVTLVVSADDPETLAVAEAHEDSVVRVLGCDWPGGSPGDYARKTNSAVAWNRDTEWVFTGADDLDFHPGWLTNALEGQPDRIGVIGTNDLFNPRVVTGTHSTHSLVRRSYAEHPGGAWGEPGTVLHEGYPHEFCDDELVGVARARGRFAWRGSSVVEHLHPYAGKAPRDEVYDLGHSLNAQAGALFKARSAAWNPARTVPPRLPRSPSR